MSGHYRCYVPKNFGERRLDLIRRADAIITDYEGKGYSLSVRQVFYQFIRRNWLPNTERSYNLVKDLINDGRLAGLISWTAIEDRNRGLMGLRTYDGPSDAVRSVRAGYHIDKWEGQDWRPEVWGEKAAQEGTIGDVCNRLQVDYFSCRGYNSQSETWRAGQRFASYIAKGQRPIVFHLGDHDPSGIDMTRDIRERLELFAGVPIPVQRLALNMPQIEELRPPPNPAKLSDARAAGYVARYGDSSWEMDALEPEYIHQLIEDAVLRIRDPAKWDAMLEREVQEKLLLDEVIDTLGGKALDDEDEERAPLA